MTSYCEAIFQTKRRKTCSVRVGKIRIGSDHPIQIQSMTTSKTTDVQATVEQIIRLADVGCDLVRVTVQGKKEALSCEKIKNALIQKGQTIPLVADIHFYPKAALTVVDFVDKIRINPGNFADRRAVFAQCPNDDSAYDQGKHKIVDLFTPLVEKCKQRQVALRIGVNHGSLSDRVMSRFGDTPVGMVESALEYADVCRKGDFHQFLFSMKSSHPLVMIRAYRLLVAEMISRGWNYPLHVGLTEAGSDQEGRVKSALAIGSLLFDGLGDTIRVSLTEDPWEEVPICRQLIAMARHNEGKGVDPFTPKKAHPINITQRRLTRKVPNWDRRGNVAIALSSRDLTHPMWERFLGSGRDRIDVAFVETVDEKVASQVDRMVQMGILVITKTRAVAGAVELVCLKELSQREEKSPCAAHVWGDDLTLWGELTKNPYTLIWLELTDSPIHQARRFFDFLLETKLDLPVLLARRYPKTLGIDTAVLAAAELGSVLAEGFGEGVLIDSPLGPRKNRLVGLQILQAARMKMFQTEFISCPGCGRTLFDLQKTTDRIRKKTAHLPGVKIAVMGCIVNGPGEMADADFGYVGSKTGVVDLYVKKTCVEKGVDAAVADERLIALIKAEGLWIEPATSVSS